MLFCCNIGLKVLKSSGIIDAYQGLLVRLCKYGLPTEDLYEFSALTVLKHEKKLKAQKKKELEERFGRKEQKLLRRVRLRRERRHQRDLEKRTILDLRLSLTL